MKVLLGVGGSDDSFRALETTVCRAKSAGDELTIAIVHNSDSEPNSRELLDSVERTLDEAAFTAEVVTLEGHPGSRLIELAERDGFDAIVLGGGETSPLGKIQLGSIAEFVLLNARTTVTLVR